MTSLLYMGLITVFCCLQIDDAVLTAENTDDSNHDGEKLGCPLREQDRFLPIANVAKIMKKAIPDSGKVSKLFIFICIFCFKKFIEFLKTKALDSIYGN